MTPEEQRLKKNQESLESYNWYKDHHVCVRCRNATAVNGLVTCQKCRETIIQTGEGMPIEITHFENGGKRVHTTLTDIPPEIINDFAHRLLEVCTERCSTSPPTDE